MAARGRPSPPVAARGRPWPPVAARRRPSPPVVARRHSSFSFCFHFGWIWVQVLIGASVDFVFISAGFGFRAFSILAAFWYLEPFWFHFGSIFVPFGVHFGTIWLLLRGLVEEKFPSKIGDRWGHSPLLHFESFWAQKGARRRTKIDKESITHRCENQ